MVRVRVTGQGYGSGLRVGLVARSRAGISSPSLSAQAAAAGLGGVAAGGPPGLVAVTLAETTKSSAPEGWGLGVGVRG